MVSISFFIMKKLIGGLIFKPIGILQRRQFWKYY